MTRSGFPLARLLTVLVVLIQIGLVVSPRAHGQIPACERPGTKDFLSNTEEYSFRADAAAGAVGDVVPVTISIQSRLPHLGPASMWFSVLVCHDPAVAEIVGGPLYPSEFLGMSNSFIDFIPIEEGSDHPGNPAGHGFYFHSGFNGAKYRERFPSDEPVPMATVFYRILSGEPGQVTELRFCNGELELGLERCRFNEMHYFTEEGTWKFVSTTNVDGRLTVLDGPPTNPDRPPEPPEAEIYPEDVGDEDVNFRVRITGATVVPGDRDVPVEVHATADIEYPAIVLPIDFDERYLRLSRVEHHFLAGITLVSNRDELPGGGPDEGHVVVTNGFGINRHRLAEAGEEIRVATLYFDVLESASSISHTTLDAVTVTDHRGVVYSPIVLVRRPTGLGSAEPEVQTEASPIDVASGRLRIIAARGIFFRGDANMDRSVDVSDAVFALGWLFLGEEQPSCLDAVDANDDGSVDVADPIAILQSLFTRGTTLPPPSGTPGEDPTPDGLGCLGGV